MNRPYGRRIARRWAYRRLLVILLLFLMAAKSSVYASDEFSRGGEEPCTSDAATCQETVPRHQGVGAQCSDLECVLGIPTTVPETKKSETKEQNKKRKSRSFTERHRCFRLANGRVTRRTARKLLYAPRDVVPSLSGCASAGIDRPVPG